MSRRPGARFNRGRIANFSGPPVINVSQAFGVESTPATLGVITVSQAMAVEGTGTTGADPIQDAINAILAMGPTVFRYFHNSAAYMHEDATNAGHVDQVIDLVASPSKDLTNATDATQPIIATVGSDTAIQTVRADVRILAEPAWGGSATNLTEALAFKYDLLNIAQYLVSRDASDRSWVQDATNTLKFYCGSALNYVATLALDTNPHLAIATFDGSQGTPSDRAKIYVDGADDTHITGTIPASLPAITAARFGSNTTGASAGSHKFFAHVGFLRTLDSTERATLRTNLKVLCTSLP